MRWRRWFPELVLGLILVPFGSVALADEAVATTGQGKTRIDWVVNKRPNRATSRVVSLCTVDSAPDVKPSDYTFFYQPPPPFTPPLPNFRIILPPEGEGGGGVERQGIAKFGFGGGTLLPTEYNGILFMTGDLGSLCVAAHSVRTAWDTATQRGSSRLGAIVNGRRSNQAKAKNYAGALAEDPLEWDLTEETDDAEMDELTITLEDVSLSTSGAQTYEADGTITQIFGSAVANVEGQFTCTGALGLSVPIHGGPYTLMGDPSGSLKELHVEDQLLYQLPEPLQLPAGCLCRLELAVSVSADTIGISAQ